MSVFANTEITDAEFAQFQKLIYDLAGISMSDAKKVLLMGRLGRRLKHYNLSTYAEYLRMLKSNTHPEEQQIMVDLLTTNETYFFREQAHFDFLSQTIIPKFSTGGPFKVWSAASSTGEEIYTLCFVLADRLGPNGNWSVLGSDISTRVLETARRGQYWLDRTRGLPDSVLRKYCMKGVRSQEGSFMIAPELKAHTEFIQVNLNRDLPDIGRFHVIFLRNVMIYFDQETKRQVVNRLAKKLLPGGYLIIGHSESITGMCSQLAQVRPTIYQLQS